MTSQSSKDTSDDLDKLLDEVVSNDPDKYYDWTKFIHRMRENVARMKDDPVKQGKFKAACDRAWFSWYRNKGKLERDRTCWLYTWRQYLRWMNACGGRGF